MPIDPSVTTRELIDELMARHDQCLVVYERKTKEDEWVSLYDFKGGVSGAIGMVERTKYHLMKHPTNFLGDVEDKD